MFVLITPSETLPLALLISHTQASSLVISGWRLEGVVVITQSKLHVNLAVPLHTIPPTAAPTHFHSGLFFNRSIRKET